MAHELLALVDEDVDPAERMLPVGVLEIALERIVEERAEVTQLVCEELGRMPA